MEPIYKIYANDSDITEAIKKQFVNLSITDGRGTESDELTITVKDNELDLPRKSVALKVFIGYKPPYDEEQLYFKGKFIVDEFERSGPPDVLTISARGADLLANNNEKLKVQTTKSWHMPKTHKYSLGDIVGIIGGKHGLSPSISDKYFKIPVKHIDQIDESDLHFLTRLSKKHDAVFKINNKKLIFVEKGEAKASSGIHMPVININKSRTSSYRYTTKGRTEYSGVKTYFYDKNKAKLIPVISGGGPKMKTIRKTFENQTAASEAGAAEFKRLKRDESTCNITCDHGVPEAGAECKIILSEWNNEFDGTWISTNVRHLFNKRGLSTTLTLEKGN